MSEKENILKELQDIAPELAKFKQEGRGTGFQVPPGYFRDLNRVMMKEIQEELPPSAGSTRSSWWAPITQVFQQLLQPQPAIALASITLLIAIGIWFGPSNSSLEVDTPKLALNNEELEAYVLANLDEFETDLLIEVYAETFLEEEEEPITEENLEEILQEMDDEDFEELWETDSFKDEN